MAHETRVNMSTANDFPKDQLQIVWRKKGNIFAQSRKIIMMIIIINGGRVVGDPHLYQRPWVDAFGLP